MFFTNASLRNVPPPILVITRMHELLPIPVRRKCTDPTSLYTTTIALLLPVHPTQETHLCIRPDVQVVRSNESDVFICSQQYLTRVWVCQVYFRINYQSKKRDALYGKSHQNGSMHCDAQIEQRIRAYSAKGYQVHSKCRLRAQLS
jgi:hypothetical protein